MEKHFLGSSPGLISSLRSWNKLSLYASVSSPCANRDMYFVGL